MYSTVINYVLQYCNSHCIDQNKRVHIEIARLFHFSDAPHQPIHAKKRRSRKQFDDVLLVMEVEDIHVGSPFAHQKSNFNILNIRRPSY
jgi:hypothetical protein